MSVRCPACGVVDCEMGFQRCLAADFSDAAYGAVQDLVVPAYGLQHGWYPDELVATVVAFITDHLDRPPSAADKARVRRMTDGPVRTRQRGPRPRNAEVDWPRTVADMDHTTAGHYVASVRSWAASVASTITADKGR